MNGYRLLQKDDLGFCNILISALGGDGANMAAKLLFKIGCRDFGLDGGYDARYGSEKKGTATDVSVRFCELGTRVRQSGPTDRPHFLVVFHADLIEPLELYRGVQHGATCIVNTIRPPDEIREALRLASGRIVCIDATKIAHDTHSRINIPHLAVLCQALSFPEEQIKTQIARQWPQAAESNLAAFSGALSCAVTKTFEPDGRFGSTSPMVSRGPIGWRNMLNGGTIDALTHTTVGRDNRIASRGRVPHFNPEACNSCGLCLTVCSDPGGLLWREGRMTGIDTAFCKGCMRCIEICPTTKKGHALTLPAGTGE